VLDRIKKAVDVDNALRQEQAGFRMVRSCNDDQIFTLQQILETVTAGRNPTIFNFIDFPKAFDSVHWPALSKILRMYGFSEQIISILQNLYQDSKCAVRTIGDTSEWFNVLTGVRQDCILSPTTVCNSHGLGYETIHHQQRLWSNLG